MIQDVLYNGRPLTVDIVGDTATVISCTIESPMHLSPGDTLAASVLTFKPEGDHDRCIGCLTDVDVRNDQGDYCLSGYVCVNCLRDAFDNTELINKCIQAAANRDTGVVFDGRLQKNEKFQLYFRSMGKIFRVMGLVRGTDETNSYIARKQKHDHDVGVIGTVSGDPELNVVAEFHGEKIKT